MPGEVTEERRGRAARGGEGLLERAGALDAIDRALDAAASGSNRALLIVGHAGMGKTRLHEAALDGARARKLQILRAAGAELERDLAFGVIAQLLRFLLGDLPAGKREELLRDAPPRLRALERGEDEQDDSSLGDAQAISHGLFALLARVTENQPALVAIDDLHWCDSASVECVLYLLHRLDELPVAIVMTRRLSTGEEAIDPLAYVSAHPRVDVETLAPLGPSAIGEFIRRALGEEVDPELIEVCREATAGNPFYLRELLLALGEDPGVSGEQLARRARSLAPDAVTRTLRVRVGRLGQPATALARAVAVLGEDVPVRHAAALAGMTISQASIAADALAGVEVLLAREPLRFVHPLVRQAIERDIPASERASRHLDAARLLYAEGAGVERVAAHLLLGRAEGDPWVVDRLHAAAREARASAASQSAVRYLERALAEPPTEDQRAEVLAELGVAEATLGSPQAVEHLAAAAAATADPKRRAELALRRGGALDTAGLHEQAAEAYEQGLGELADEPSDPAETELRDQLHTAFVLTAAIVPSLQDRARERAARALEPAAAGPYTQGQRLLLVQAAAQAVSSGAPSKTVNELATRAWDNGRLLAQADPQWIGWRSAASVLCLNGDLEQSLQIIDAAQLDARRRGWPLGFATTSYVRALPRLWQGRVDNALADLEHARDARRYGWQEFVRSAAAHYALCLIERDELDQAERALDEDGPLGAPPDLEDVLRTYSLAELRLAQGRPAEALELAVSVGEAVERPAAFFGYCPWRATAAQAAIATGNRDRALELAAEGLERAEANQVLHERIRALRIAGMCEGGGSGIERLRAAVELGEASPPRLESVRALVDLGAALRRSNERAASRPPLQQAADLAKRGGALALERRARTELSASGARPRRDAMLSGPESLTPSERRIAELAATGQSNREIAGTLFVTPKTVEYHLRNVYRKLDIQKRSELSGALEA